MDGYCNQGKDDYNDIHDSALGVHYVRYKWCANEPCMRALGSLIFLLEYSSVYSRSCFITDARACWRSLWGSVVFEHTGIRRSKQLVLTEELLMPSWIVNNNTKKSHLSLRDKWNLICDVEVCTGLFFFFSPAHAIYSLFVHISDERQR